MSSEIYIEEAKDETPFVRHQWRFVVHIKDGQILIQIEEYRLLERKTARHKYNTQKYYYRLNKRGSDLRESEIPMLGEITQSVLYQVQKSIIFNTDE